jgi:putative transposase
MTQRSALSGIGKPWMEPCTRPRWEEKKTGRNPTDRGKSGGKRSLLTDGRGVPLGLAVAGANVNDYRLAQETLESMPVERPTPGQADERGVVPDQGMCLDAGYFYQEIYDLLETWGYTAHIRPVGSGESRALTAEEKAAAGVQARRWVVERTHSWLNRFRGLLIRWNKKPENYLALLHFACALIAYRAIPLLG